MFRQISQKATFIRFRRWSRAKYAVFCSLSTVVTIGRLAVSIADKSQQKSVDLSVELINKAGAEDSQEEKKKKAELDFAMACKFETILSEISFHSTAACGRKLNYLIFI